jgi:C-methyltransferase C-terminal domain/Methyltransferase domain
LKTILTLDSALDLELAMDLPQSILSPPVNVCPPACSACGGLSLFHFFEMSNTPTNRVTLRTTQEQALACTTGIIDLVFCESCGAISNVAFDSSCVDYDATYDNSLHFSPTFQRYSNGLARYLIKRYDLHEKSVMEIGSGKGAFLSEICLAGNNSGVGFEPTYVGSTAPLQVGRGLTIVPDYYSEEYPQYSADFVICRQVLEHILNPRPLLACVRKAITNAPDGAVFFEVPSATHIFRKGGFWDVLYEHCVYYSPGALANLFTSCGFEVLGVSESFGGQYVCLEARPYAERVGRTHRARTDLRSLRSAALKFSDGFQQHLANWRTVLKRFETEGKRVILWGAGTKGTLFLNTFSDISSLEFIVDVNPNKWGRYIPGSGQRVISPDSLKDCVPDVILIMNPNYHHEISSQLNSLGLAPKLMFV